MATTTYYQEHKESIIANSRRRYYANREAILEKEKARRDSLRYDPERSGKNRSYFHEHYIENRESIRQKARARYLEHREDVIRKGKEYAAKNKDKLTQLRARHYKANKDKIIARSIAWRKRINKVDPAHNLKDRLRNRLYCALRAISGNKLKCGSSAELIGCSLDDLKKYIESLFLPGMSWDNRHLWHVDHKRPCSSFDLLNAEQQKQCFHYSNLQPLWAKDNLRKSNRILGYK